MASLVRFKVFYLGAILLFALGILIWSRREQPMSAAGQNFAGNQSASPPSPPSRREDDRRRAASTTIRSTRVSHAEAPKQQNSVEASSAVDPEQKGSPLRKPNMPIVASYAQQAPKTATEILAHYIDDDPTQVFLPNSVQYHAAVQSEPIDPEWGPAASQAIRDYLSKFGDRFEFPLIDCRQDLCELEAVGRLGSNSRDDLHDFQDALNSMRQQPWWSTFQFDQDTGLVSSSPDGRAIIIWFYSRK